MGSITRSLNEGGGAASDEDFRSFETLKRLAGIADWGRVTVWLFGFFRRLVFRGLIVCYLTIEDEKKEKRGRRFSRTVLGNLDCL